MTTESETEARVSGYDGGMDTDTPVHVSPSRLQELKRKHKEQIGAYTIGTHIYDMDMGTFSGTSEDIRKVNGKLWFHAHMGRSDTGYMPHEDDRHSMDVTQDDSHLLYDQFATD